MNVHIQHPPEAEVQIHQVARVQPGQRPVITEGARSVQQRSQPGSVQEAATEQSSRHPHTSHTSHTSYDGHNGHNGHGPVGPHYPQSEHVGRCFQETVDGQVRICICIFSLLLLSSSFRIFSLQPLWFLFRTKLLHSFHVLFILNYLVLHLGFLLVYLVGKHPSKYA